MTDLPETPTPPGPQAGGPALCARHADRVAAGVCDNCGTFACSDCLGWLGPRRICIGCVQEGRVTVYGIPWDKRRQTGLLRAWAATTWETISKPVDFYRRLDPRGRVGEAFVFSLLSFLWLFIFYAGLCLLIGAIVLAVLLIEGTHIGAGEVAIVVGVMAFYVVAIPVCLFGWLLLLALVHHVVLLLLGGGRQGLGATVRVDLFTSGVVLAQGIPCLNYIAWIWYTVLFGFGLRQVHRDDPWKPAIAVATPILLCCGCLIGYYVFIIALAAST